MTVLTYKQFMAVTYGTNGTKVVGLMDKVNGIVDFNGMANVASKIAFANKQVQLVKIYGEGNYEVKSFV